MLGKSGANMNPVGYQCVDSTIFCVLTRFRLRYLVSLPFFYLLFFRVRREAQKSIPGLLKAAFLVENLRVCYTFSVWADERSVIDFGTYVQSHVSAARTAFGHTTEIWSAQWRLWAVSQNLAWTGLGLKELLAYSAKHDPGTA